MDNHDISPMQKHLPLSGLIRYTSLAYQGVNAGEARTIMGRLKKAGVVVASAVAILVLTACAQRPQAVTSMAQQTAISVHLEKSYQLGVEQKTYIGASMVRVQRYAVKAAEFAIPNTSFTMSPPL